MRKQESVSQKPKVRNKATLISILCFAFCVLAVFSFKPFAFSAEKWPGVDESVIEKYAKEHGREAREPFINTDQGDLLLFVFLLAGTMGGFAAGYYWRVLTESRAQNQEHRLKRTEKIKSY